jgi:hypothetical protein
LTLLLNPQEFPGGFLEFSLAFYQHLPDLLSFSQESGRRCVGPNYRRGGTGQGELVEWNPASATSSRATKDSVRHLYGQQHFTLYTYILTALSPKE